MCIRDRSKTQQSVSTSFSNIESTTNTSWSNIYSTIDSKTNVATGAVQDMATSTQNSVDTAFGNMAVSYTHLDVYKRQHEKPVFSISSGFFELDLEELGDKSLFLVSAFMVGMRLLQDGYPAHVKVI